MPRYIDADEYCRLEGCPKPWKDGDDCGVCIMQDCKTLDVQPVVHARWIPTPTEKVAFCSNCEGFVMYNPLFATDKYCRFCGAKMDEKEERYVRDIFMTR